MAGLSLAHLHLSGFQIVALAILGVGIFFLLDSQLLSSLISSTKSSELSGVSSSLHETAVIIFITVAVLIAVVSFFGCCGAWRVKKTRYGIRNGK